MAAASGCRNDPGLFRALGRMNTGVPGSTHDFSGQRSVVLQLPAGRSTRASFRRVFVRSPELSQAVFALCRASRLHGHRSSHVDQGHCPTAPEPGLPDAWTSDEGPPGGPKPPPAASFLLHKRLAGSRRHFLLVDEAHSPMVLGGRGFASCHNFR